MFSKIVLLLWAGGALANNIKETPAELITFFEQITTQVNDLQQATLILISSNEVLLDVYISDDRSGLVANITTVSKPYWVIIRSLEESAQERGQDISSCITIGNDEMDNLNSSLIEAANTAYDHYNETGNELLEASTSEANSVTQELNVLKEVVAACHDETCATSLTRIVTQYYSRAKNTLSDAETKILNYVSEFLPLLLAQYQLDDDLYTSQYTTILKNVTTCISELPTI